MKYVVVSGGVVSGLGKGVTISSMGRLLQACGVRVTAIKIDPYLNVDAGTMSPFEHGECFVLGDGGETDLDLGNYERFLNIQLTSDHNITTGKIYRNVILKERRGDYLGKTVQVVPHLTNEIQDWIERVAKIPVDESGKEADVCLIEVGGTVGDIESSVFLEALRQFQFRVGDSNFVLCFVSLVPILSDEQKTKPTQHGVRDLRSLGLSPKIIFCRSTQPLEDATKHKISSFCHVPPTHVLSVHDVSNVYYVPSLLQSQNLHELVRTALASTGGADSELKMDPPNLGDWQIMAEAIEKYDGKVKIALIGKYTGLQDSYLSVIKALKHAAIKCESHLDLLWVEATQLEKLDEDGNDKTQTAAYKEAWAVVESADGVIVPGGFGNRGFLGKMRAAEYCRTNKVPYLGVCLGFQAMVVEYCRSILGWDGANSTEFNEDTPHPVVIFMPEVDRENMGGTMRLGSRITKFTSSQKSTTQLMYNSKTEVSERHRHRYEVNPDKVEDIESGGKLQFVGRDETGTRMEVAELPRDEHPYYVGVQYHPEYQSRPLIPSPPFHGLVLAACGKLDSYLETQKEQN